MACNVQIQLKGGFTLITYNFKFVFFQTLKQFFQHSQYIKLHLVTVVHISMLVPQATADHVFGCLTFNLVVSGAQATTYVERCV